MSVRDCDDQDPSSLDAINDAERIPAQQVAARSLFEGRPGRREPLNGRNCRVDLVREPYGRRLASFGIPTGGASASSSASSRNSVSRRTARRGVDTLTRLGPGNCRRLTRINAGQASVDLGRPGRLGIRIHIGVQTLDKLPRQSSTLFSRKLKGRVK